MSRLKLLKRRLLFEVFIHNDMEAAMKVKSGNWIITSARVIPVGAALSIAIAVIGYNKSCTIATVRKQHTPNDR
ncbi:DUF2620 family protein [Klebsiella pneumoniae]|uniref:DUF2620 family protein n=1 Tax=Klebsiella pneumoniae TaxID=573 RepID=UPI003890CB6E